MKKNFLFTVLAVLLAGFGFGGVSLAACDEDAVACIGDAGYTTVADAITAYGGDGEILIKKTNGAEESLTTNKDVTLNLNGNTINACVTVNGGTLTIKDKDDNSGKIVCSSYIMQVEVGTLKIYGGTYENGVDVWVKSADAKAEIYDGIYRSVAGNTAAVWAYNGGIIDIHGGTFRGEINPPKNGKCFWAGGGQVAGDTHGIVNIDGGDFDGRISASEGSEYHISGGSFAGTGVAKTAVCSEFDGGNNDQEGCMETDLDTYLVAGYVVSFEGGKYIVQQASRFSQIQHDADVTAPGTSTNATYTVSEDGYTMTVSGKIAFDAVHGEVNRYGVAITTVAAGSKNGEFSGAIVYLKKAGTDDYVEAGNFWDLYEEYPDYNPGLYWYPAVTKRNQTDYLKIVWAENIEEVYTINVVDAILDLPEDEEVSQDDADTETATLESELVIPTYNTEETDENQMFTVTIGTGDDAVVYEGIPASKVTLSETVDVEPTDVATDSNHTATIEGKIEIDFSGQNAMFSKPLGIKIKTDKNAKIKVKHAGASTYTTDGLTTDVNATCTDGIASPSYGGDEIAVDGSGYVTIYTCSASTFVAYTEEANQSSSSSTSNSGGGGGGSSKTTKTDDTKATTEDSTTANETNTDENNSENAEEQKPTMTEDEAIAKFGQEQIDAYKWALENGITTMKTVEAARLDQPLTRAELAKMMVVYIQKVVNKDPVITGDVTYKDVDESLGDLFGFIKLAYQYQIMGINANGTPIELFNPYGIVSRGEYATVFSRVLFGDKFNKDGEDFYAKHLDALKAAEILTNTTPTIQEMRGWVMLMMYRSSQNSEAIEKVANSSETNETEKAEESVSEETTNEEATNTEEEKTEDNTNTETATDNSTESSTTEEAVTTEGTTTTEETNETTAESTEAVSGNTDTTTESNTGDVAEANTGDVASN